MTRLLALTLFAAAAPAALGNERNTADLPLLPASALHAARAAGPWAMRAFAVPANPRAPSHTFAGRLVLGAELPGGQFQVQLDRYGDATSNGGAARHLPPFDFVLVQRGGALIPQQRGAVRSSHPEWEFVLEPGRVWDQDGDGGLTRAALPFALQERNANCLHNGVLTFLFGEHGELSNVAYEIGQETCAYFQFDAWGLVRARYVPGRVANAQALIAAFAAEVRARVPSRPIATLATDYPGSDPSQFGSVDEVNPADMTLYGVVVDGIHYTGGCATRFGPYPYCDELDLPSYSLAKTLLGGLALMRAARLDPAVVSVPVTQLVPQCAPGSWEGVTLGNVLDMTTGHYNSGTSLVDEDNADMGTFFLAEDHETRIRFACEHYPHRSPPGEKWVYHTADTYLLGTALAAWLRARDGSDADFFTELLIKPIWHPLRLNPAMDVPRRTRDASNQPFTGYGLTMLRDDIVKLALFIAIDAGRTADAQVVDAGMLRAALQQDPAQPGLQAGEASLRYKSGLWAWNAQAALGCSTPTWIPFLSGYGGIIVALLPNGMIYYYFSDGGVHAWARAAREADRMRPFCRKAT